MTTPATLPAARPTQNTYGSDLTNRRPVTNPNEQLDAASWNKLRADVAQMGATSPLAVVRLTNNGTAAIAAALGIATTTMTLTRSGVGVLVLTMLGPSGITSIADAFATPHRVGGAAGCTVELTSSTSLTIRTTDTTGAAIDCDVSVQVF